MRVRYIVGVYWLAVGRNIEYEFIFFNRRRCQSLVHVQLNARS